MSGLNLTSNDLYRGYYQLQNGQNIRVAPKTTTNNANNVVSEPIQKDSSIVDSVFGDVGSGNTCTDGKDDGKIGFFSALANIGQGIVRGATNMIKGAFTDENGKFSLWKTIKTVAIGAACIAFPAVGMVACGIGVVAGGAKLIKGVANAVTAETDAEAKAAWENVGAGGLTVGLSVVGAKASYNAVQASAGGASSAMSQLAGETGKTGFFANLKSNPLQTIKALGKDAATSTKNGFTNIKSAVSNYKTTKSEAKELIKMEKAKSDALLKQKAGKTLTPDEQAAIDAWNNLDLSKCNQNALQKINSKNLKEYAKGELKTARKNGDTEAIASAKATLKDVRTESFQSSTFGKAVTGTKNVISKYTENTRTAMAELAKNGDKSSVLTLLKNARLGNADIIRMGLSNDCAAIYQALTAEGTSYAAVVSKYGYKNVMTVIEAVLGTKSVDLTV